MTSRPPPVHWLAGLAVVPILVWWLGWHPGFATSDTIDQWRQLRTEEYLSNHPPIHTFFLDVFSLDGGRPGLVTLIQTLLLGVLLVYAAKWLIRAGVPAWLAVGVGLALGLSPAVAPTTLTLWKDIPFALFMLWAWIELLAFSLTRETLDVRRLVRLGVALAGVWLFRGNGPITVLMILVVLAIVARSRLSRPALVSGVIAVLVVLVTLPLYGLLQVTGSPIEPAQVFLPDLAASYVDEPETFTSSDLDLMNAVAPRRVWTELYDCYDSTALLFDPRFDQTPVRESPGSYRGLELDVLTRDFDTVVDHRVCASNFVYWPDQPEAAYLHRPEYDIPANDVGLSRDPLVGIAFEITDRVWRWAEVEDRLWLTWRPAILVIPALLGIVAFAVRPAGRTFLLPSALLAAHTLNVAATSPAQEFRYAFPLYLMAVLTLTLLYPTLAGQPEGTVNKPLSSSLTNKGSSR